MKYIVLVLIAIIFKDILIITLLSPIVLLYFRIKHNSSTMRQYQNNLIDKNIVIKKTSAIKLYMNGLLRYYCHKISLFPSHHLRMFCYKRICRIMISHKVIIYSGLEVREPYNISIGKGTVIGSNVILDGRNGIVIGENVNFSSNVIYNTIILNMNKKFEIILNQLSPNTTYFRKEFTKEQDAQ